MDAINAVLTQDGQMLAGQAIGIPSNHFIFKE